MKIITILSALIALSSCTPSVLKPWDKGAFETREFRNVFVEAGYSPEAVEA